MDRSRWVYSRGDWFKLPLALRQRWWRETDYNRVLPSRELQDEVDIILGLVQLRLL